MAIQLRGGISSLLVKSKLKPREACVTTDTGEFYYCYAPGQVKKAATIEELQTILDASPEAFAALQQLIADLDNDPSELTNILSNISALQSDKLDKTGDSASNTVAFTEASTLANIATGETHATLFGKIKKFFSFISTTALTTTAQTITGAINELKAALSGKVNTSDIIQTTAVNNTAKVPSSAVTYGLAQDINTLSNNTVATIGAFADIGSSIAAGGTINIPCRLVAKKYPNKTVEIDIDGNITASTITDGTKFTFGLDAEKIATALGVTLATDWISQLNSKKSSLEIYTSSGTIYTTDRQYGWILSKSSEYAVFLFGRMYNTSGLDGAYPNSMGCYTVGNMIKAKLFLKIA